VILADGTIVDLGCQTAGKWAVEKEGDWAVAATAPTKGLLVLRRTTQETRNVRPLAYNDYAIADIKSHQMTSDLLLRGKLRAGSPVLAEGARVVCSEVQAVGQKTWKLQCWNLPDGEAVTLADELADFRVARGSLSSARVIAERWDYHRGNLLEKSPDLLSSMIVDLRSGKQFAAMKPRPQRDYPSGEIRDRYFRLALSPNGELLAEGGDGVVTLQRLP
jgi:hypothetical protein